MSKFDNAIIAIESKTRDIPISYFFAGIPSVGTGLAINNGAGWNALYFLVAGFLIMILHAFFTYKLVSEEAKELYSYSWIIRLTLLGIYFFSIPILFIYFSYSLSLTYYGGTIPL